MTASILTSLILAAAGIAVLFLLPGFRQQASREFCRFDRNQAIVAVLSLSGGMVTLSSATASSSNSFELFVMAGLAFFLIISGLAMLGAMALGHMRQNR